ncbi:MAG: hypothetical protein ACK4Z6_01175 [Candidatus Methylomirabilales bacterium]
MTPLEERMAKLEGAFEQMNARLGSIEGRLSAIETEIRSNFRWLLGTQLTMWITIIAAILLRR